MHNMMVAHAKAVVAFHEGGFEGEIGIVQNLEPKYPLDPNSAADCEAARMADVINNRWVLDATFRGHYAADTMEPRPSWPISPAASSTSATRTSPR